ncbi:MAG: MBL fold metallo-hydrolase [Candidatus Latescibacter sp.]|nr:MBL fold metallo-hydrolase [Candidatus Latescibacter sp.]
MKASEGIHIVGSGRNGIAISNMFDSHVYLLENPGGHVMIDAGVGLEVDRITENIRREGFDPKEIGHLFMTHVHSDHAGGCAELKKRLGLKVYISKAEAPLLRTGDELGLALDVAKRDGFYPPDYFFPGCEPDVELAGGEKFTFDAFTLEAIHVPGHSPGSTCYLVKIGSRVCLFSGDVVVHGGKLMFLNCVGSDMADMRRSMPKLANLGVQEFYPGHGCIALSNGQNHINTAIEGLRHLVPPPNAL